MSQCRWLLQHQVEVQLPHGVFLQLCQPVLILIRKQELFQEPRQYFRHQQSTQLLQRTQPVATLQQ